ncbi:MAG: family 10 glycosylhydrolase [Rhodothermaceae bacterium]|nr:family 10 glycosylhydrolase [Rhodothermaceae bacterium]
MKRITFIITLGAFFLGALCVALLPESLPAQATARITPEALINNPTRSPAQVTTETPGGNPPLAQTQSSDLHPTRGTDPEFRGAWIATVANLDWPASPDDTPEKQRADLVRQLEILKQTGFNAVFFQVRTECDALYDSPIEPWSHYLTGKQGDPPFPLWDPLEYAIQESHKRGMELHAWLNPYRTARQEGLYPVADDHITKTRPDLLLRFRGRSYTSSILDPGNPEVVEYIARVTADIVRRYDLDGIHFDDYFYPYQNPAQNFPGITGEDAETFRKFNRGFADIGDWRRDNINLMVAAIICCPSSTGPLAGSRTTKNCRSGGRGKPVHVICIQGWPCIRKR